MEENITKNEYLKNENNFLDEIKNNFYNFWNAFKKYKNIKDTGLNIQIRLVWKVYLVSISQY